MKNIILKIFIKNFLKKTKSRGFSLIELSVVILVVSVLAAGFLSVLIGASSNDRARINSNNIERIYSALKIYVATNKVLPCPAPITDLKLTDASYGTASATSGCASVNGGGYYVSGNLVYGMVPVKTLGLASEFAQDSYGNKFAYIVDKNFTIASDPNPFSSDSGSLVIENNTSSGVVVKEANAIFAIIGYGANQSGAFPANSATQIAVSSDTDEVNNGVASFDANLIYSSSNSNIFDDTVFYKNKDSFLTDARANFLANSNTP
jgi:prepilin-type N-terminal cleavage/methylation domain-containing protein